MSEQVDSESVSPFQVESEGRALNRPGFSKENPGKNIPSQNIPRWMRVVPFFLSAFFFLSGLLTVFAPLPLLFLYFRKGRGWAWAAIVTNAAIVAIAGGSMSLAFYAVFGAIVSIILPEVLIARQSLEKSVVTTLAAMAVCMGLLLAGYAQFFHVNPFEQLNSVVTSFVNYVGQNLPAGSGLSTPDDLEEWKKGFFVEFPSAVAIFSLVVVWANMVLVLRANPNGIREKLKLDPQFLKKWKAPEFLVWPTIVAGFFLVFQVGVVSDISLNIFKFLMAIYVLQGLSILGFLFDIWGIKGIFRMVGFSAAVFLMLPLVLSLGFVDLWFDFRSKFRHS